MSNPERARKARREGAANELLEFTSWSPYQENAYYAAGRLNGTYSQRLCSFV
jgi:hypothetical protein